ncbi:unnamed protein product [Discula destructiva]
MIQVSSQNSSQTSTQIKDANFTDNAHELTTTLYSPYGQVQRYVFDPALSRFVLADAAPDFTATQPKVSNAPQATTTKDIVNQQPGENQSVLRYLAQNPPTSEEHLSVIVWLRSERLHKYRKPLATMNWDRLLNLTSLQLLCFYSVSAKGARDRLVRRFAAIKKAIVAAQSLFRGFLARRRLRQQQELVQPPEGWIGSPAHTLAINDHALLWLDSALGRQQWYSAKPPAARARLVDDYVVGMLRRWDPKNPTWRSAPQKKQDELVYTSLSKPGFTPSAPTEEDLRELGHEPAHMQLAQKSPDGHGWEQLEEQAPEQGTLAWVFNGGGALVLDRVTDSYDIALWSGSGANEQLDSHLVQREQEEDGTEIIKAVARKVQRVGSQLEFGVLQATWLLRGFEYALKRGYWYQRTVRPEYIGEKELADLCAAHQYFVSEPLGEVSERV